MHLTGFKCIYRSHLLKAVSLTTLPLLQLTTVYLNTAEGMPLRSLYNQ